MDNREEIMRLMLNTGGYITNFVANGTSMQPLLHSGDKVTISKPDEITINDLALYKRANGKLVLHRVVRIYDNTYGFRGDNTYFLEIGLGKEDIIGVITAINRNGKYFNTNNMWYQLYSRIWTSIYPIRYYLHNLFDKASDDKASDPDNIKYVIAVEKSKRRFIFFKETYLDGFYHQKNNNDLEQVTLPKATVFNTLEEAQKVGREILPDWKLKYGKKNQITGKLVVLTINTAELGNGNKLYEMEE